MADLRNDSAIVAEFLAAVNGYGPREVARLVEGISPSDLTRWRAGGAKRLSGEKRRALLRFLEQQSGDGAGDDLRVEYDEDQPRGAEAELEEMFREFDNIVRFMSRMGPAGEARGRKLAALDGVREILAVTGGIPDWYFTLRTRVENGEL